MESIQMLPPRRVHQLHAGYVHDHGCAAPDPVKIARFQAEAAEHARLHKAERLSKGALAMVTAPSGLRQHRAILFGRSWIPRHDTRDPWHSTDVQRVSGRADRGIPRDWRGQGIPDSQSRHRGDPLGGAGGGRQRVAEQGSNKLGRWDPITREITEYQDNVRKHTVRIDPRTGYVWSTGAMTRFDPKTEKYDRISEAPSCYGIALDQQGNAWFTELTPNGKVGMVDAKTLKVTKYTLPTANGRPRRIQVDDKGIVWFAEFEAGKIGRLDPKTGAITEFQLPGPQPTPYALGIDRDGKVWYSSEYMDVIGRLDPETGKVIEYPYTRAENSMRDFFMDDQGRMWFGSPPNDKVGYFYLAKDAAK
jgi:virginiamycin B lyase